jgi:hypothetical protein
MEEKSTPTYPRRSAITVISRSKGRRHVKTLSRVASGPPANLTPPLPIPTALPFTPETQNNQLHSIESMDSSPVIEPHFPSSDFDIMIPSNDSSHMVLQSIVAESNMSGHSLEANLQRKRVRVSTFKVENCPV